MVSLIGVGDLDGVDLVIKFYLVVKYMVDEYFKNSNIFYVILCLGILLNESGMYLVIIDMFDNKDDVVILREDVVIVIVECVSCLINDNCVIYLFKGEIFIL